MGSDWTDHAGDFVGIRAVDYRELDGFLRVCEEFDDSASCGGRTDMYVAILRYPGAKAMIQLVIRNFTQAPTPNSQRQNWSSAEPGFPESVLEDGVVIG